MRLSVFPRLFALHRHSHAEGLGYVNRSASFQWFRSELTSFRLSQVTIEEYGVSKKWVMIMDKRQDKNSASTPAETLTSGPSAQDRYCARGS